MGAVDDAVVERQAQGQDDPRRDLAVHVSRPAARTAQGQHRRLRGFTRAQRIADYPWFKDKGPWLREIKTVLRNGFKMEVESLITNGISYVTNTYMPQRLREKDSLN